jgi:hypothetical protein
VLVFQHEILAQRAVEDSRIQWVEKYLSPQLILRFLSVDVISLPFCLSKKQPLWLLWVRLYPEVYKITAKQPE